MCNYKQALQLHKLINQEIQRGDWVDLHFQQVFSDGTRTINLIKTNSYKIGLYLICNDLHAVNSKIDSVYMHLQKDRLCLDE